VEKVQGAENVAEAQAEPEVATKPKAEDEVAMPPMAAGADRV